MGVPVGDVVGVGVIPKLDVGVGVGVFVCVIVGVGVFVISPSITIGGTYPPY